MEVNHGGHPLCAAALPGAEACPPLRPRAPGLCARAPGIRGRPHVQAPLSPTQPATLCCKGTSLPGCGGLAVPWGLVWRLRGSLCAHLVEGDHGGLCTEASPGSCRRESERPRPGPAAPARSLGHLQWQAGDWADRGSLRQGGEGQRSPTGCLLPLLLRALRVEVTCGQGVPGV